MISTQLLYETVENQPFTKLPVIKQDQVVKARLKQYGQKVYRKLKITEEQERVDTVCMRENPFYVDTVRAFRDRRYEYKALVKKWRREKMKSEAEGDSVDEQLGL